MGICLCIKALCYFCHMAGIFISACTCTVTGMHVCLRVCNIITRVSTYEYSYLGKHLIRSVTVTVDYKYGYMSPLYSVLCSATNVRWEPLKRPMLCPPTLLLFFFLMPPTSAKPNSAVENFAYASAGLTLLGRLIENNDHTLMDLLSVTFMV